MSKWSLLKSAILSKSVQTISKSRSNFNSFNNFDLIPRYELSTEDLNDFFIRINISSDSKIDSLNSLFPDENFIGFIKSILTYYDVSLGRLQLIFEDEIKDYCDLNYNLSLEESYNPIHITQVTLLLFPPTQNEKLNCKFDIMNDNYSANISTEATIFYKYSILNNNEECFIYTRERKDEIDTDLSLKERLKNLCSNQFYGVDNTGNVRVWAAEQILLFTILENKEILTSFKDRAVLEIGAGLTGLLGLALFYTNTCQSVHVTDGHPKCISNINICNSLTKQKNQRHVPSGNLFINQLRWVKNDTYDELKSIFQSLSEVYNNESKRFDFILGADCLFFTDFHHDLLWLLDQALSFEDHSRCYLMQPSRGNTMEKFIQIVNASNIFDVEILHEYSSKVSEIHEKYRNTSQAEQSDSIYNPDIHYPIMIILKRKKTNK